MREYESMLRQLQPSLHKIQMHERRKIRYAAAVRKVLRGVRYMIKKFQEVRQVT